MCMGRPIHIWASMYIWGRTYTNTHTNEPCVLLVSNQFCLDHDHCNIIEISFLIAIEIQVLSLLHSLNDNHQLTACVHTVDPG